MTAGVGGCSRGETTPALSSQPSDDSAESALPLRAFSAALHVHSCFSEGPGSMQAQLSEAHRLGLDVVGWTDHDWRMQAVEYWSEVGFQGEVETRDGMEWRWEAEPSQSSAVTRHEFRVGPDSISDKSEPHPTTLYMSCANNETSPEECRLTAVAKRDAYRTSLHGQTFEVDIFPEQISETGALTFDISTSDRPALQDRSAGKYHLSYRVGGPDVEGSHKTEGRDGTITLAAPPEELDPAILPAQR